MRQFNGNLLVLFNMQKSQRVTRKWIRFFCEFLLSLIKALKRYRKKEWYRNDTHKIIFCLVMSNWMSDLSDLFIKANDMVWMMWTNQLTFVPQNVKRLAPLLQKSVYVNNRTNFIFKCYALLHELNDFCVLLDWVATTRFLY